MNFYWVKTNRIIKYLFSKYIWSIDDKKQTVYLTFDDGPTPEITQWTLNQLRQYNAKATFFCIGDNIKNHPEIFSDIISEGHSIGNHTFSHVNGWQTNLENYIKEVNDCEIEIGKLTAQTTLFRPPYGKIRFSQSRKLRKMGYKIIMWDVLSADFDTSISPQQCLDNVLHHICPGSIVIFHDSVKAFKNLEYALPETLRFLKDNGYKCEVLT